MPFGSEQARARLIEDNEIPPLPDGWDVQRFRFLFRESKERNGDVPVGGMLSVSEYRGVVPKEYEYEEQRRTDEELQNYRVVRPGQLAVNTMWLNHLGLGVSDHLGHVSPAYAVYDIADELDKRFAHHLFRSQYYLKIYLRYLYGIRPNSFQIKSDDWNSLPVIVPPRATQKGIADFLDCETARIDQMIEKKQRLLELLDERFSTLVNNKVGGGTNLSDKIVQPDASSWRFVAIGREITLQRGVDITKDGQDETGPYPVVSSGGVSSYHNQYICRGPGVIIGRKGSAGKLHYEHRNHWPHDTTLYVKRFEGNIPRFVFYKLMALDLESFDRSSANPTINRNLIHPQKVWWPNETLQKRLVDELDREEHKLANLKQKIRLSVDWLYEFRAALITSAVTGQIDVATWGNQGQTDRRLDEIEEAMRA